MYIWVAWQHIEPTQSYAKFCSQPYTTLCNRTLSLCISLPIVEGIYAKEFMRWTQKKTYFCVLSAYWITGRKTCASLRKNCAAVCRTCEVCATLCYRTPYLHKSTLLNTSPTKNPTRQFVILKQYGIQIAYIRCCYARQPFRLSLGTFGREKCMHKIRKSG